MIGGVQFLLFAALLVNAVNSEIISASDDQTCMDLCASSGGTSTFDNQVCHCCIPDNDEKASECMKHVQKRRNEKLKLGLLVGQEENVNRSARCCPTKSKKHMRSTDVDRVINYFVNGGPTAGTPIIKSAQTDCETNETTSPVKNERELAPVPKEKVEPATDRSTSGRKNVIPAAPEAEIVTTSKASEEVDEFDDLHAIQRRSFLLHQHRLLSALPQVLFAIPQALAAAVTPMNGARYPLVSVPHRPNIFGKSQYPNFHGIGAPLPYGFRSNEAVPIHLSANNQEHIDAVSQAQRISPYLIAPNALLAGARTPLLYDSLLRAPQNAPEFGFIEPRLGDVKHDAAETTDEGLTPPEELEYLHPLRDSEGTPALLHGAIVQQNGILEGLSERLHNYALGLETPRFEQFKSPLLGYPESMRQCHCSEQNSKIGATKNELPQASDRVGRIRNRAAKSAGTSTAASERKPTEPTLQLTTTRPVKVTTNPPITKPQENSTPKSTTIADEIPKTSRQSAMNNQEFHWQYLPQYLNQFPGNAFL